jgi:hypothetical protein
MIYANASLQQSRIREAVKDALSQITTGNGYKNTIVEVLDEPPTSLSAIQQKPAVMPIWGPTRFFSETNYDVAFESLLYIYAVADEQSNVSLSIENLTGDVLAAIGLRQSLPHPTDNVETVQRCRVDSIEPFGNRDSRPAVGVKIGIKVWWSISYTDPSTIGSAL